MEVAPPKIRKYFPNLKRELESFPFIEELEGLIKDQWERSDKRSNLNNMLSKLHPLEELKVNSLIHPPVVDAFLTGLARQVTLPIEAAVGKMISGWSANIEGSWPRENNLFTSRTETSRRSCRGDFSRCNSFFCEGYAGFSHGQRSSLAKAVGGGASIKGQKVQDSLR